MRGAAGILRMILAVSLLATGDASTVERRWGPHGEHRSMAGEEEGGAWIFREFRAFLGFNHPPPEMEPPSPSPSPAARPHAPAAAPIWPAHGRPRHYRATPQHKRTIGNGGRKAAPTRTLVAALAGVSIMIALCLCWVCLRFRRHHERAEKTKPACSDNGDRFELNPAEMDMVMDPDETTSDSPLNFECRGVVCSSAEEIESGRENYESVSCRSAGVESLSCESDHGCRLEGDDDSSEDESFHSFDELNPSGARRSGASVRDVSDKSKNDSADNSIPSPSSPPSVNVTASRQPTDDDLITKTPSNLRLSCSLSPQQIAACSSVSALAASKPSSSSTLPDTSSPAISSSSSGTKQTPVSSMSSSPPDPPGNFPSIMRVPPPPPPPLMKGGGSSVKTPPPPPLQLPRFMPPGKGGGALLPKLKPLHWDKVRAAPDRSMVWDKLRSSSFEFDEEMIESLFGYNLKTSMAMDETKCKSPPPSKHVLEPKRLQNITILSKALNATAEQVCEALVRGDGLSLQQLEALAKMAPTKEEEAKLNGYKGDVSELGSAERLMKMILNIPSAFQRIQAMLYRDTFEDEVEHVRKSFSILEEACRELRSSRLFLKLLEAVLKTGNRMNVGTARGGARAFKLDALLKLADVKGTDGKTTLLHFVVQEMIRSEGMRVSDSIMGRLSQKSRNRTVDQREEDYKRMGLELVTGLAAELCNVKKTASMDLDVIASSVSNLSEGMGRLLQMLGRHGYADEESKNLFKSMREFMSNAERKLRELREDEDKVLRSVRAITEYFHGDTIKEEANPLRIFVIVRDFLGMLDHVCKELRRSNLQISTNPMVSIQVG